MKESAPAELEPKLERHLAVVLAAIFERGDLEQSFDRAEVGHDHLPLAHRAVEEILAQRFVRRGVLEDAAAGDARGLDSGAFQQFAPATRPIPDR